MEVTVARGFPGDAAAVMMAGRTLSGRASEAFEVWMEEFAGAGMPVQG